MRRKLAGGRSRFHFYAWRGRGAPKFWEDDKRDPTDPDFFVAYAETVERPAPAEPMVPDLVDASLDSAAMPKGERSKADLRRWVLRFAAHFQDAPAVIFEKRASRGEVNAWRAQWKHSPKQHDMAGTHAVRVFNWAVDEGRLVEHHYHRLRRLYEVDRSEIVWSPADRDTFDAVAPEWVRRILCVACETGLRPGDLGKLTTAAVEMTPKGRRLRVRTRKRGKLAHTPITPALAQVIDTTPKDRLVILVGGDGKPMKAPRNPSNAIRATAARRACRTICGFKTAGERRRRCCSTRT
ncbi:MAG: tyrosine-type recombinase/integrase [Paracoccaceae bacterium]